MADNFEMPDPNAKKPILKILPCEGCGALPHPTSELCYLRALRAARLELAALKAHFDDPADWPDFLKFKKLRAEVKALPPSAHTKQQKSVKREL